jgi:hypothetical protein
VLHIGFEILHSAFEVGWELPPKVHTSLCKVAPPPPAADCFCLLLTHYVWCQELAGTRHQAAQCGQWALEDGTSIGIQCIQVLSRSPTSRLCNAGRKRRRGRAVGVKGAGAG